MLPYDLPLRAVELPVLLQHRVGHADLADVVEPCSESELRETVFAQPEAHAHAARQLDDLIRMLGRVAVAHVDRRRHCLDAGLDRFLELLAHRYLPERDRAEL